MPPKTISLLIADDHPIYRDGLSQLLKKAEGIRICGEAADGNELLGLVAAHQPDLVLTDLRMPRLDGIEAIRRIRKTNLPLKMIALSNIESDYRIVEALEAGADGYLQKNADRAEILEAIQIVTAGNPYYCRSTTTKLARLIGRSRFNPYTPEKVPLFSALEKKIIHLVCEEKSTLEISTMLCLGKRTIDGYRSAILEKMAVKTQAGLAIYAIKNGLYTPGME